MLRFGEKTSKRYFNMLIKNEYYRELSAIPELYSNGKYSEAIRICLLLRKKHNTYTIMFLLGVLYIAKALFEENKNILNVNKANKSALAAYTIIKNHSFNEVLNYLADLDLIFRGIELYENKNDLKRIRHDEYKYESLSRIYSKLANVNCDINESLTLAHKALEIYNKNEDAYQRLLDIYDKNDKKKKEALLRWVYADITIITPLEILYGIYLDNNSIKEACCCCYYIARRKRYVANQIKKEGLCEEYIYTAILSERLAHELLLKYYWNEKNFKKAQLHLLKCYALWKISNNINSYDNVFNINRLTEELKRNKNCIYWFLYCLINIDNKIDLYSNKDNNLIDIYNFIKVIENDITALFKDEFNVCLKCFIKNNTLLPYPMIIISKVFCITLLYTVVKKYLNPEWSEKKYLTRVIEIIFKDFTKETYRSLNLTESLKEEIVKQLNTYDNSTRLVYIDIINIIKKIIIKYNIDIKFESVNALETIVHDIAKNKSAMTSGKEKELVFKIKTYLKGLNDEIYNNALLKIDINHCLLSSISKGIIDIKSSQNRLHKYLYPSGNADKITGNISAKICLNNEYYIITHENNTPKRYMSDNNLKNKNIYNIWVDQSRYQVWIDRTQIKFTPTLVHVLTLLLIKYPIGCKYEELVYCAPTKAVDNNNVHQWMSEISYKMGKKVYNKYIIPNPGIGYMIKEDIKYCVIFDKYYYNLKIKTST